MNQRGFSLVEVLVATAIGFTLSWMLIALAHATIFGAAHLDARTNARASADRLAERLTSDAASAWSIFVPNADVLGGANADGHEIDFVTEDAAHRQYWWAYRFDATADRVTKYAYGPGSPPVAGDVFEALAGFAAATYPVTDLTRPGSAIYDPLFAASTPTAVDFPFDWNPQAVGGNHLVAVAVTGSGITKSLLLASATAPTHVTVIVEYTPAP